MYNMNFLTNALPIIIIILPHNILPKIRDPLSKTNMLLFLFWLGVKSGLEQCYEVAFYYLKH